MVGRIKNLQKITKTEFTLFNAPIYLIQFILTSHAGSQTFKEFFIKNFNSVEYELIFYPQRNLSLSKIILFSDVTF